MSADVVVIIPFFNTASYIEGLRDSLSHQGSVDLEVVAVDDGSTDGTREALAQWAAEDDRLHVFAQANRGQSAARNLALRYLRDRVEKPEYIDFLDSDDQLEYGALERLCGMARARELDMLEYDGKVVFESQSLEEQFSRLSQYYMRDIPSEEVVTGLDYFAGCIERWDFRASPCMRLLSSGLLLDNGIEFCEGIIHEDNLFTVECFMHAERVAHCDDSLYLRTLRQESTMTAQPSWRNIDGYFRCVIGLIELANGMPDMQERHIKALSKLVDSFCGSASTNPSLRDEGSGMAVKSTWLPGERIIFDLCVERRASEAESVSGRQKKIEELTAANQELKAALADAGVKL